MSAPISLGRREGLRRLAERDRVVRWGLGLVGLLGALAVWQVTAALVHSPVYPTAGSVFGDPGTIVSGGNLSSIVGVSLLRMAIGFALSAVIGVVSGLLVGYLPVLADCCSAVVGLARSIPFPLVLPLMIVVAGLGRKTVVLLIVLT